MQYLLAIDVGTTSLKATLFDCEGRTVASHISEYSVSTPHEDWVELDPQDYWRAATQAIRHLLDVKGISADGIAGIGVTSQGESLVVLDDQGKPLRPTIVWLDNRSHAESDELRRHFGEEQAYLHTGQPEVIPTWTATRILWLKHHEPRCYKQAAKYLLAADYLIYRLTGRFTTDRGLNPSTLYYDLPTGSWWGDMLDVLGISQAQLPELVSSGEVAGHVSSEAASQTGLRSGTAVTTAPIDQISAAVGAGNIDTGVVTECTGAALALCATSQRPVYDPDRNVGLYAHAMPGKYVLFSWAPTAGMILRWLRDTFGNGASYDELDADARDITPGANGLFMLPHLAGAGTPTPNAHAKGVFWGITLAHNRSHFVRAVMESVAFLLRGNMELLTNIGEPVHELRCLGGGARSDLWLQIKADVCRRNLVVMDTEEATGLGTAMIAAVGAGLFDNLRDAGRTMVRVRKQVAFNPNSADRYESIYRRYVEIDRHSQKLFVSPADQPEYTSANC